MVAAPCLVSEGGARALDLVRSVLPASLDLREPCERQVAMLTGLRLIEDDPLAIEGELPCLWITLRQRNLGEQQAGLQITPGVLEALEDFRGDRSMRPPGGEVVRIDGDQREQPLACRFTPRVEQLPERRAG